MDKVNTDPNLFEELLKLRAENQRLKQQLKEVLLDLNKHLKEMK